MSEAKQHRGRIFWGLLLIILGTLFLLDQLGCADFGDLIGTYWPLILILIGVWNLVSGDFRTILGPFFLIVLGVIFLLNELDYLPWSAWSYLWAVLIILLGAWILIRPAFGRKAGKVPEIKADDLDAVNVFSGLKRTITSQKFRGGKAVVVFGGMELDLTAAGLEGGQATVDLTAVFGGMEIWIPKEWKVVVDAVPILGGVDDKHRSVPDAEAKGTLYVKATAIFGGIEIKN